MNSNKINAIIVDDEDGCIANLQYHLARYCPDIHVADTASSLSGILDRIVTSKIDLAFLDVELFDDNIFNDLQKVGKIDFKIVFVTAHEKYALKAWKVDALDYVLKPLSESDIKDSYLKIQRHFLPQNHIENSTVNNEAHGERNKKVIIKGNEKIYVIKTEDIFYISGNGFYSTVSFMFGGEEKSVIISKPLNKVEAEYSHAEFYRVHKSHIINVNHIAGLTKDDGVNVKMKNGKMIPVAKRRANEFLSFLNHAD